MPPCVSYREANNLFSHIIAKTLWHKSYSSSKKKLKGAPITMPKDWGGGTQVQMPEYFRDYNQQAVEAVVFHMEFLFLCVKKLHHQQGKQKKIFFKLMARHPPTRWDMDIAGQLHCLLFYTVHTSAGKCMDTDSYYRCLRSFLLLKADPKLCGG